MAGKRYGITLLAQAAMTLAPVILSPSGAVAGPKCAPHKEVIKQLGNRYGETRQSMGLDVNNAVVEIFASEASGTWTITVTKASGVTCLVASGKAFEKLSEKLPRTDSDL